MRLFLLCWSRSSTSTSRKSSREIYSSSSTKQESAAVHTSQIPSNSSQNLVRQETFGIYVYMCVTLSACGHLVWVCVCMYVYEYVSVCVCVYVHTTSSYRQRHYYSPDGMSVISIRSNAMNGMNLAFFFFLVTMFFISISPSSMVRRFSHWCEHASTLYNDLLQCFCFVTSLCK